MEPSVSVTSAPAASTESGTEPLSALASASTSTLVAVPEFTPISPVSAPVAPASSSSDVPPHLESTTPIPPSPDSDVLILSDTAPTVNHAPASASSSAAPTQTVPSTLTETEAWNLPSITPGATLPGGIDILFREIPLGCRQLLTLADISESANFRGYFTVCELLALKQVLLQRYQASTNGGISIIESPPPAAAEEQVECESSNGVASRKQKLKRSNANSAGGGSKRRSSWSASSTTFGAVPSTSKQINGFAVTTQGMPELGISVGPCSAGMSIGITSGSGSSSTHIQLPNTNTSSAGIVQSGAPSSSAASSPYIFCPLGCCTLPATPANPYYSNAVVPPVGNACEGMGSVDMELEPKIEPELLESHLQMEMQECSGNGNGNDQELYFGGEIPQPSSATIHYTVHGASVCPPHPNANAGAGRQYQPCPPYIPYLENIGPQSLAQSHVQSQSQGDVCGLGATSRVCQSHDHQYHRQQDVTVRSLVPGSGPGSSSTATARGRSASTHGPREVRHGLPPPPPYRSLALVTKLLKIGNYYFRSFSEVNPNRCKVLFNTQHLLYECHLPIVHPMRETQPLRKLLTIDVKFEQITHMQFDTDKLFLRVNGAPGLTITYNPVTPEDRTIPPLSPDDQCLLNNIENGQLTLSPCHELYFLNERLVHNLQSHFREMPQFSRFFYYEQSVASIQAIQGPGPPPPCRALAANGCCSMASCPYSWNPQQQPQPQLQSQQQQTQQPPQEQQHQQQQAQRQQ